MKQVDEIIYDAIRADADLMTTIGGRVVSTCFEVSPDEADNTPVPYIIVTDDGFQAQESTKDDLWDSEEDRVQASVEVAAESPNEVKQIIRMVRRAVNTYIAQMREDDEVIPTLQPGYPSSDILAWDWLKPCYYKRLTYQCTTQSDTDYEQD